MMQITVAEWDCTDDEYETAICPVCEHDTEEPYGYVLKSSDYKRCPNCGTLMVNNLLLFMKTVEQYQEEQYSN